MRKRTYALVGAAALAVALAVPATWLLEAASRREHSYDLQGTRLADESGYSRAKRSFLFSLGQTILPIVCRERTVYAPGYREESFRSLKLGTSESELRRVLGEPLLRRAFPDGVTVLYYSKQATGTDNYLLRNVVLDANGRCLERQMEFYVD